MSTDAPVPHIVPPALAAVYAEARRCYPREACGLLLGPADQPSCDEALPCENQQDRLHQRDPQTFPRDARTAYALGGPDLLALTRSLGGPRPVKVVFHSHVDVGAYFSAEDRRAALFEDELLYPVDYLVVDCQKDGVRGAALFRYQGGDFAEVQRYPGEAGQGAAALGDLGDPSAIPALSSRLNDADVAVRRLAASALGLRGDAAVLPLLDQRLRQEPDVSVQAALHGARARLGAADALPALLRLTAAATDDPGAQLLDLWEDLVYQHQPAALWPEAAAVDAALAALGQRCPRLRRQADDIRTHLLATGGG